MKFQNVRGAYEENPHGRLLDTSRLAVKLHFSTKATLGMLKGQE